MMEDEFGDLVNKASRIGSLLFEFEKFKKMCFQELNRLEKAATEYQIQRYQSKCGEETAIKEFDDKVKKEFNYPEILRNFSKEIRPRYIAVLNKHNSKITKKKQVAKERDSKQKKLNKLLKPINDEWKKLNCTVVGNFTIVSKLSAHSYHITDFMTGTFSRFRGIAVLDTSDSSFEKAGKQYGKVVYASHTGNKNVTLNNGFQKSAYNLVEAAGCKDLYKKSEALKKKHKI